MRGASRRLAAGLLFLAAGCDGGDGTGPTPLAPEDVAGTYRICSLAFAPASRFLPAVDIRARAFDTASAGVTPPRLKLDATRAFELEYTPRGQFTVSKGDYEWLLGESDPGIPTRVEGRLTGRFSAGACP